MAGTGAMDPAMASQASAQYPTQQAAPTQAGSGFPGVSPVALAAMLDPDLKGLGEMIQKGFADQNKPTDRQRDALALGYRPGTPEYASFVGTQYNQGGAWQPDGRGGIRLAPGYAEGQGMVKGAEAGAQAQYDLVTVPVTGPDGQVRNMPMSRAQALQMAGAQPGAPQPAPTQPAVPAPAARAPQSSPEGFPVVTPTEQAGRDAQRRVILEKELQNFAPGSKEHAAISAEIAKLPRAQAGGYRLGGETEGQRKFGETAAAEGAKSLFDGRTQAQAAADSIDAIQQGRAAIKSGAFLGAGADLKTDVSKFLDGYFGIKIAPETVSNTEFLRSTLGKEMLDNAKKLGYNPTDADAKRLDVIIGTISKDRDALLKLMDWREDISRKAIDRHNRNVDETERSGFRSPMNLRVEVPKYRQPTARTENVKIDDLIRQYAR